MSRYTTSDVKTFSVYFLKKYKKLDADSRYFESNIIWSRSGEETGRIGYTVSTILTDPPHVKLNYKTRGYGEDWESIEYKVPLERVACNFGGFRWFFRCPLSKGGRYCGTRVAVLYQVGSYFGCRHCADLTYESCNEGKGYRTGIFKVLSNAWKSDDYLATLKRTHYKGRPTRKYRRYMKLAGYGVDVSHALEELNQMLGGGKI